MGQSWSKDKTSKKHVTRVGGRKHHDTYPKKENRTGISFQIRIARDRRKGIQLKVGIAGIDQHLPGMRLVLNAPNPIQFVACRSHGPGGSKIIQGYPIRDGGFQISRFQGHGDIAGSIQDMAITNADPTLGRIHFLSFGIETHKGHDINNDVRITGKKIIQLGLSFGRFGTWRRHVQGGYRQDDIALESRFAQTQNKALIDGQIIFGRKDKDGILIGPVGSQGGCEQGFDFDGGRHDLGIDWNLGLQGFLNASGRRRKLTGPQNLIVAQLKHGQVRILVVKFDDRLSLVFRFGKSSSRKFVREKRGGEVVEERRRGRRLVLLQLAIVLGIHKICTIHYQQTNSKQQCRSVTPRGIALAAATIVVFLIDRLVGEKNTRSVHAIMVVQ